jgi:hypothetical protein
MLARLYVLLSGRRRSVPGGCGKNLLFFTPQNKYAQPGGPARSSGRTPTLAQPSAHPGCVRGINSRVTSVIREHTMPTPNPLGSSAAEPLGGVCLYYSEIETVLSAITQNPVMSRDPSPIRNVPDPTLNLSGPHSGRAATLRVPSPFRDRTTRRPDSTTHTQEIMLRAHMVSDNITVIPATTLRSDSSRTNDPKVLEGGTSQFYRGRDNGHYRGAAPTHGNAAFRRL